MDDKFIPYHSQCYKDYLYVPNSLLTNSNLLMIPNSSSTNPAARIASLTSQ